MYVAVRSRAPATRPAAVRQRPATASSSQQPCRVGAGQQLGGRTVEDDRVLGECRGRARREQLDAGAATGRPARRRAVAVGGRDEQARGAVGVRDADLAAGDRAGGVRRGGGRGDRGPDLAQRRRQHRLRRTATPGSSACRCSSEPAAARVSDAAAERLPDGELDGARAGLAQEHGDLGQAEALAAVLLGHRERRAARQRRAPARWSSGSSPARSRASRTTERTASIDSGVSATMYPSCATRVLLSRSGTDPCKTVTCSTLEARERREGGARCACCLPARLLTNRVYIPYARIPAGRMVELPGRGSTYVTDTPGPSARLPHGAAAARRGLHGPADLVPLDRAAVAALPRRDHGPALARPRDPVRGVLAPRLRRRRRRADRRARACAT